MEDPEVEILGDKLAMAEYKRNIKINEEKDVTIRRLYEKDLESVNANMRKELELRECLARLMEEYNRKHNC